MPTPPPPPAHPPAVEMSALHVGNPPRGGGGGGGLFNIEKKWGGGLAEVARHPLVGGLLGLADCQARVQSFAAVLLLRVVIMNKLLTIRMDTALLHHSRCLLSLLLQRLPDIGAQWQQKGQAAGSRVYACLQHQFESEHVRDAGASPSESAMLARV